jgi:hypothetical protein
MAERPRAYELPKTVILDNQRRGVAQRHAALRTVNDWRKNRPGMSEAHLALIRQLPCVACPALCRSDPHHLRGGPASKERSFGVKSTDRWAVPICRFHHEEVHRIAVRYEADLFHKWRLDPYALANALWHGTGDLARMKAILDAHKQAAFRKLRADAAVGALMRHGLTRAEAEEQYAVTRDSNARVGQALDAMEAILAKGKTR